MTSDYGIHKIPEDIFQNIIKLVFDKQKEYEKELDNL